MIGLVRYAPWLLAVVALAGVYWLGGVNGRAEVERLNEQIESVRRMDAAEKNLRGTSDDGVRDWLQRRGK